MQHGTFEAYIQWVYSGVIVVEENEQNRKSKTGITNLVMLYAAGDMLGDVRLRNAVIDRIILNCEQANIAPGSRSVTIAYDSTPEGSTLRKLIVDWYLSQHNALWFKNNSQFFPRDFLVDLVYGRMANNNQQTACPIDGSTCKYHEHDQDEPSCDLTEAAKLATKTKAKT